MRSRGCFPMSRHPLQVDQIVPYYWRQGLWEVPWCPPMTTAFSLPLFKLLPTMTLKLVIPDLAFQYN